MNATLIVETATVFAGFAIIAEPATKAYLAVAKDARSAAAARRDRRQEAPSDALTALVRESLHQAAATVGTPVNAIRSAAGFPPYPAGAADEGPAPAVPASRRAGPVLAAKSTHPDWSWAQIGESTGMSGPAARGVFRRSVAAQNGTRA